VTAAVVSCGGDSYDSPDAPPPPPAASSDATLSALALPGIPLEQAFQPSQTSYSVAVSFMLGSLRIVATTSDPGATLEVNGVALVPGQPKMRAGTSPAS